MNHPKLHMTAEPITIFVPEVETFGGAERSVIALSRWLYERSLPHRIVLYYDRIGLADYADHPIDIITLNPRRNPIHKVAALKRHFKTLPRDAPCPLVSGIQAALHATLAGIRGFHTLMHDTPSLLGRDTSSQSIKTHVRRAVSDRVLRNGLNSGGITFVHSTYLRDESIALWHPPVVIARTGGVVGKNFRPRIVEGQLRMLSVSRIEANKRIEWMLQSLAELDSRKPGLSASVEWVLDIVGDGSQLSELRDLAGRLGLAGKVTFHGFVSDAELMKFYERSDLFLMPARQGYGLPAAEALAHGIPILIHRESGISDILGGTPWAVVMDGRETDMTEALKRSIDNLLGGKHLGIALPQIPTQDDWSEQVARACRWYGNDEV